MRERAIFAGLLVLLALACHKKSAAPSPPPPSAPAPIAAPPPIVTLNAEPETIDFNHSVTLSWSSQNATELDLEPGVGKVQGSGSTSVTLRKSTTYTLSAKGPGGTRIATLHVTVRPPEPPPSPYEEGGPFSAGRNVVDAYFDFDKASIGPDAEQALSGDADLLREHPSSRFTIEGHCDERGSEEYNLALGDRRAIAAKNFLVRAGVSEDRIHIVSYGKNRPVSGCDESTKSEDCWQRNRVDHFHYGWVSK
jgi:peptidoglycan-associated lipoprotein